MKLVGFTELGPEADSEDFGAMKTGKCEKKIANHVLQLTFTSFSGFRFPFARAASNRRCRTPSRAARHNRTSEPRIARDKDAPANRENPESPTGS